MSTINIQLVALSFVHLWLDLYHFGEGKHLRQGNVESLDEMLREVRNTFQRSMLWWLR